MHKKNIWLLNHYATSMFFSRGGRHYWLAKNLLKEGYKPTIFCANTIHNRKDIIETNNCKYIIKLVENIPFVFVKAANYQGNGFQRMKNMISFCKNLFPATKDYVKSNGKPDVILASSVHPLTLVAGIKIAKKIGVPCICEVRDLWPESLVAYGALKRNSILAKILYQGEKWIYKKADSIIMTWEGGKDYIVDRGWDKDINLSKIHHISNGVDIDTFDKNCEKYQVTDADLDNPGFKNIVYAGSIRKVNNLGMILDAAKIIKAKGFDHIRFLIYGSGDETERLQQRCKDEEINNIIFKGRIEKKYIPFVLKKAYVNLLHNSSTSLDKYGQSQNKLFEYLAAGKCIVQTYSPGYSICDKYNCGISVPFQDSEQIAKAVIMACTDQAKCELLGRNARQAAYIFDFKKLTDKLIDIIDAI